MRLKPVPFWLVIIYVGTCTGVSPPMCEDPLQQTYSYKSVLHPRKDEAINFKDLPGFTRSVYRKDYALITPESRVWTSLPRWKNASTAHVISGASGAQFSMYLANVRAGGFADHPPPGIERFVLVLEGSIQVELELGDTVDLEENSFAYIPPDFMHRITSRNGGGFLVYEHRYRRPDFTLGDDDVEGPIRSIVFGVVDEQQIAPAPGEMFVLRKLLPETSQLNFNVHIMDFKPGEHLFVKEVHYNQHGLMLLQGKGIYRLGSDWYPVQSGDAIWMAPYTVQWYAALGQENSRYIIYKDTLPPDI